LTKKLAPNPAPAPDWSSGKLAMTQPVAIVFLFLQMIFTGD